MQRESLIMIDTIYRYKDARFRDCLDILNSPIFYGFTLIGTLSLFIDCHLVMDIHLEIIKHQLHLLEEVPLVSQLILQQVSDGSQ